MTRSCLAIILAAGEGTRMRSSKPKVMHKIAGLPMLHHVIDVSAKAGCDEIAVVAGTGFDEVNSSIQNKYEQATVFEQKERLGTGHAVLAARDALVSGHDDVIVLFGDTPLLRPGTLLSLREQLAKGAAVAVLGFQAEDPTGYGRLIVEDGELVAIREHKDASEAELDIKFCNGGIMGLAGAHALQLLDAVSNDNAKGEYYLTDVAEIARANGLSVSPMEADESELLGVNNRNDLAEVEAIWQRGRRSEIMNNGVTMHAPETVFLSWDTVVGQDVELEPNIVFGSGVTIGDGVKIRGFSHIEGATVGEGAQIGPFARLRPGTNLAQNTKVGNFVEVKNANVAGGAKINHLTYVGDARIGADANIGAGTITCNYDGINKHVTEIGSGAFIGSNSALVAPVRIGDNAYVASGSVITEDVPDEALGIARGEQVNKHGYATKIRERNQQSKKR